MNKKAKIISIIALAVSCLALSIGVAVTFSWLTEGDNKVDVTASGNVIDNLNASAQQRIFYINNPND